MNSKLYERNQMLLNKKIVYSIINDCLLAKYPSAKNPYNAVKMHLEVLRETIVAPDISNKNYDLLVSEILYFEWYIKSDDIAIIEKLQISQN
jgi:hypothetical protein